MGSRVLAIGTLILLLIGSHAVTAATADPSAGQTPAARIEVFRVRRGLLIRERSVGVLFFRGNQYPIKIRGFSPRRFREPQTLELYHFDSLDDLEGLFLPQSAAGNGPSSWWVLRNERGVEIRIPGSGTGEDMRIDAKGVVFSLGKDSINQNRRKPPPAPGRLLSALPSSAGIGSTYVGPILVTPTLNVQTVGFAEVNNGWGGKFDLPLRDSQFFYEQSNEEGLNASLNLGRFGIIVGRVSGVFSMEGGGLDAGATNFGNINTHDYGLESGYVEWASGPLFPELGYDAITISGGPQNYTIADGFLFTRGATNGDTRGGTWLNPRTAFGMTGIITLATRGVEAQAFYLQPNDEPSERTKLAGINLETSIGEYASTGFTYCNIFHSDNEREDGMNVFYWRGAATPIPRYPDFHLIGAFVAETNGRRASGDAGWYVSPYYHFSWIPWTPTLYYRYASFSGGGKHGDQAFDPLFYGSSDWGSWYQGEILGNWLTTNSNLISHQVRVEVTPTEATTFDVILYKFLLYSREQDLVTTPVEPVTSKDLADEVDLIFQYAPTAWWIVAVTVSTAIPNRAATQMTGGTQTWVQSMLTTGVTF